MLDILTGSFIDNPVANPDQIASSKNANALAVGINVIKLANGKVITITTTSDNKHISKDTYVGSSNAPVAKVSWKEITEGEE